MTTDDDTLRAILDGLRCGPVHITADRCTGDIRAVEAFCDLVRVAPALAAEVLRLRAELAALRAPQDGYITTSRPGAAIEVQERCHSAEELAALDFGRKPFGGGR